MATIGFIGLGVMGSPMARNLTVAGYELVVHNRSPSRAEPFRSEGVAVASTLADVIERCDVVLTCLGDDRDVESVVGRELIPAMTAGQLLIDTTTSAPELARRLHTQAADRGVDVIDAPVSGGQAGAEAGTLTIMVGGNDAAVQRARPLLEAIGSQVTHVGPAGAGQVCKAANQMIVGTTIAVVAEALLLAERAGVDPVEVREALQGGFADSRVLEVHGGRILSGAFDPGFRAELHQKDLRLALDLARQQGTAVPVTGLVDQLFTALVGTGHGDRDHAMLAETIRHLSAP